MLIKMLKKDFLKNKVITAALFIFIVLSALLVASGTNMITELTNSLNALFTKSSAPHFVQMHAGTVNHSEIDAFAAENNLVKNHQVVEMLLIDGRNIDFGNRDTTETNSIMDHYFVKQNHSFDLLLNLESEEIQVSPGEIAVPIYFMQKENIAIGDKIRISTNNFNKEFIVVDFVRDVQMNPSIIHSKRFVVSEADLALLKKNIGQVEYLIEFQLNDVKKLSTFRNEYQSANLPQKGPNIDYPLFKTLNAITDGIVSAVMIFVSILLNMIALLCIRFTILAAIEEDYREIGVMKAIGISLRDIKKIYVLKYIVLAASASAVGYGASLFINHLFTANMMLYMGTGEKSMLLKIIPFITVIVIFFMIVFFCMFILRRFNKISAIEALRLENMNETGKNRKRLVLHRNSLVNIHVFLGLRDILGRLNMYRLLFFMFFICAFIIIVPVNFLNTIQSPDFIKYMGVERSDIRIDLPQSDYAESDFENILSHIANDPDVEKFAPLVTSQFKVINSEGTEENITIETGDFSVFSLEYLKGHAPTRHHEIALSYLNSEELKKNVGDTLRIYMDGQEMKMVVSGIYQDVTNGGRTAKALFPPNGKSILWYKVSVDVKPNVSIHEKIKVYGKAFYPAKVTDLQGYANQTFGNTIDQLRLFTTIAIIISICISVLITSLFLKMLMAKDYTQISIMKSIGFSAKQIRIQYVTRTLFVLVVGIILGTIISNTIGQWIVSALLSFMGASEITFSIDPVKAYIVCPLILIVTVVISTLLSTVTIKKSSIASLGA
ncbi:FtsX-like permease family protein [Bacillus sp. IITD106]|nr:FtsX-like permease family protein [Bacillus sp. IITD106]